ncbi:hypothetical protein [Micromonospora sp. WMMD975]|uniref:hypothetical protein n=1 Tax=Micromonospora sp. WMMD975 TaxID=3016087 RepID=UPI00249CB22B|nr:hypothetical protein [Micromonospora sp. WMMD975]WFE36128.1 hypothetical protein O7613_12320 [Micromonospora sp. WMMD975]
MAEAPIWPYRPQALATYHHRPPGEPARRTIRSSRRPLVALAALLMVCVGFAAVTRVPRAVDGAVLSADGPHLVAVFAGRVDPAPGAEVTLNQDTGRTTVRVVRSEIVDDEAAARRWRIPTEVARPATVVLLSGAPAGHAYGRLSLVVAEPTLLQMLPEVTGALR